jgi:hypothetical protein
MLVLAFRPTRRARGREVDVRSTHAPSAADICCKLTYGPPELVLTESPAHLKMTSIGHRVLLGSSKAVECSKAVGVWMACELSTAVSRFLNLPPPLDCLDSNLNFFQ